MSAFNNYNTKGNNGKLCDKAMTFTVHTITMIDRINHYPREKSLYFQLKRIDIVYLLDASSYHRTKSASES